MAKRNKVPLYGDHDRDCMNMILVQFSPSSHCIIIISLERWLPLLVALSKQQIK